MSKRFRAAGPDDAESIAHLHADSWRRHYRGAYADSFLDGDVVTDRLAVWSSRLAEPAHAATILAEEEDALVGFVHVVFDSDNQWGSLVDNLHVTSDRRREGTGRALMAHAAQSVVERAANKSMYLLVLAQNLAAQQFYQALSGVPVEKTLVSPPGGVRARLNGTPSSFRYTWPDALLLVSG